MATFEQFGAQRSSNLAHSPVSSLIRQAMHHLDADRAEARRCLRDACALLGIEPAHVSIAEESSAQIGTTGVLAKWQVRRALEFIEQHVGAKLAAGNIAAAIGLSKSHFSRAFKNSVGFSPMAYVAIRRVERAKALLQSSAESLADVALTCGFADQSHLHRHFQRVVGSSPGRWRRALRSAPGQQNVGKRGEYSLPLQSHASREDLNIRSHTGDVL